MHRVPLSVLVLATALALAGCDAGDEPGEAPRAGLPAAVDGDAEFAPVNRSGVTGSVRADHGGEETTVAVEVAGLQPGGVFPVHVHTGRCAAGGPVTAPLGRITARQDSTGRLTARVASTSLDPSQPAFVQIHREDGSVLACADLADQQGGDSPLTETVNDTAGTGEGGA